MGRVGKILRSHDQSLMRGLREVNIQHLANLQTMEINQIKLHHLGQPRHQQLQRTTLVAVRRPVLRIGGPDQSQKSPGGGLTRRRSGVGSGAVM